VAALPASAKSLAVLDRTKEPGAIGEPLYCDVVTALAEAGVSKKVIGGRYGLGSKEFTPAMVKSVYEELLKASPKNHFTIGINEDVTHTSLDYDPEFSSEMPGTVRALFYGLGADGTWAPTRIPSRSSAKRPLTSRRATSFTIRRSPVPSPLPTCASAHADPLQLPHQQGQLRGLPPVLVPGTHRRAQAAEPGATFCSTASTARTKLGPPAAHVQRQYYPEEAQFYVIDGYEVAKKTGMGGRVNTIMQTCFFAISGVLPREEAIEAIKHSIEKTTASAAKAWSRRTSPPWMRPSAISIEVKVPAEVSSQFDIRRAVPKRRRVSCRRSPP